VAPVAKRRVGWSLCNSLPIASRGRIWQLGCCSQWNDHWTTTDSDDTKPGGTGFWPTLGSGTRWSICGTRSSLLRLDLHTTAKEPAYLACLAYRSEKHGIRVETNDLLPVAFAHKWIKSVFGLGRRTSLTSTGRIPIEVPAGGGGSETSRNRKVARRRQSGSPFPRLDERPSLVAWSETPAVMRRWSFRDPPKNSPFIRALPIDLARFGPDTPTAWSRNVCALRWYRPRAIGPERLAADLQSGHVRKRSLVGWLLGDVLRPPGEPAPVSKLVWVDGARLQCQKLGRLMCLLENGCVSGNKPLLLHYAAVPVNNPVAERLC